MIRRLLALHEASKQPCQPTEEIEKDSLEYLEVRKIITEKLKQTRERTTIEIPHGQH